MKIVIGATAQGKNVAFDLDTLITTRLLIQANSGAGKSYLLRKLIEALFGHAQIIMIDPEGEFATLREKYDFILAGPGGETPTDARTAEQLAIKLLELRVSAVCDLYEMKAADRHEWVAKFLSSLVDAPKKLWHRAVIIVDEAQMFCPEKSAGESKASGPMIDLTTRGRKRGFCAVWATQRLANVNKDATSMLLNRLVGGTFEDVDIKRALNLLSVAPEDKNTVSMELKTLEPGWFYAFGRAISKERLLFKVGKVETSHPQPGSAKHAAAPPPPPDKVKALLPQLADLPQEAEQKAATLADFKKRVSELQRQLRQQPKAAPVQKEVKVIDQEAIQRAVKSRDALWMKSVDAFNLQRDRVLHKKLQLCEQLGNLDIPRFNALEPSSIDVPKQVFVARKPTPEERFAAPRATTKVTQAGFAGTRVTSQPTNDDGQLPPAKMKLLGSLAAFEALGRSPIPKNIVATWANVSHRSSGFENNLGALRSAGYIDYPAPGKVALTDEGRKIAPQIDPPTSPEEMLERAKSMLPRGKQKVLDALAQVYPDHISKAELAEKAGVSATSSGYENSLGSLRSAGMCDYPAPKQVKLAPWLMMETE